MNLTDIQRIKGPKLDDADLYNLNFLGTRR